MSNAINAVPYGALLIACLSLPGCATPGDPPAGRSYAYPEPATATNPVIRAHRYTLISIKPLADQRDLLRQIVDIRIPDHLAPTVQDAMAYTLRRSGYRLCPGGEDVAGLYALPLPAAHYRLGPLPLREALQVLAGPAWNIQVDERARMVCFEPRAEFQRGGA